MKSFKILREDLEELFDIIEFSEESWNELSEEEQAELEEASNGGAVWTNTDGDKEKDDEVFEDEDIDENSPKRYQARNTQKRRKTQLNKDRNKFKDRSVKLKAKIDRKKGSNKVKRLKLRKKWIRRNKSKIANANRVFGGKIKSRYTKK